MDTEHVDPSTGELKPGPFFRTPYNYDVQAESDSHGLRCCDPSLAQQQFKDDADINVLMARYGVTGRMPDNPRIPTYGDFTGISDYRQAVEAVQAADAGFMALPATIRARFENDPQNLLMAFEDPSNRQALTEMGFLKPAPVAPAPAAPAAENSSTS